MKDNIYTLLHAAHLHVLTQTLDKMNGADDLEHHPITLLQSKHILFWMQQSGTKSFKEWCYTENLSPKSFSSSNTNYTLADICLQKVE